MTQTRFLVSPSGQLRGFVFAKHLILRHGADEAAAGKVSTGDAELRQRATTPAAPVEENHAGHLCICRIVTGREVDYHLPQLARQIFCRCIPCQAMFWQVVSSAGFSCAKVRDCIVISSNTRRKMVKLMVVFEFIVVAVKAKVGSRLGLHGLSQQRAIWSAGHSPQVASEWKIAIQLSILTTGPAQPHSRVTSIGLKVERALLV